MQEKEPSDSKREDDDRDYVVSPDHKPKRTEPIKVPLGITPGKCGSCKFLQMHELPTRDVYFCRRLATEMTTQQKDKVEGCPVWEDEDIPQPEECDGLVVSDLYEDTSMIYGELRDALAHHDVDLKTLMIIAHPNIHSVEQLSWIDKIPPSKRKNTLAELADSAETMGAHELAGLVRMIAERLGLLPH